MKLQQQIGNQSFQRLLKTGKIQAKLKVSQPSDRFELEADKVGQQILNMSREQSISPKEGNVYRKIDRSCKRCEEEDSRIIKISTREFSNSSDNFYLSDHVTQDIDNVIGNVGSPLDSPTREFMESRFGYDFSNVRIHSENQKASRSAESINASAFTFGNNIVFGAGQYNPHNNEGKSCWHMN